jgi:HNH endonuclease
MSTVEDLQKELSYDPLTGRLSWLTRKQGRKDPSKTKPSQGYLRITVRGKRYYQHVLAFILQGVPEPLQVDHINGNRVDNRGCNLRAASPSENNCNKPGWGLSGIKNIYKHRARWVVRIRVQKALYTFSSRDLTEAISWRDAKLTELHEEFKTTIHQRPLK